MVCRQMFNWDRLGTLFDPAAHRQAGWLHDLARAPSSLVFDDFVRVYFGCRSEPDERGQCVCRSACIDLERKNLLRVLRLSPGPVLALGNLGTFDEFGTCPISVTRDQGEIRAYYGGWTRCESVPFDAAIGCAVSADGGEMFTRIGAGPVLSYSPHEPFVLADPSIAKYGDTWRLWYAAGRRWQAVAGKLEPVTKIRMASSPDGINWTKLDRDIVTDSLGEDEVQAGPSVTLSRGRYHLFFSYRHASHLEDGAERDCRIGYAFSEDLRTWTRDDSRAGIEPEQAGWDSEVVAYPHLLPLDGAVYLIYVGIHDGRRTLGLARLGGVLE